jgi:hypothetical protein
MIIGPGGYMVSVQKIHGNKNDVQNKSMLVSIPKIDVVFTHNNNFKKKDHNTLVALTQIILIFRKMLKNSPPKIIKFKE